MVQGEACVDIVSCLNSTTDLMREREGDRENIYPGNSIKYSDSILSRREFNRLWGGYVGVEVRLILKEPV